MVDLDLLLVSKEHSVGASVRTKWNTRYRFEFPTEKRITLNSYLVGHEKTGNWGHPYEDYFGSYEKDGEVGRINLTNNRSGHLYLDDKRIAKYERIDGRDQAFIITTKDGLKKSRDLPLDYLLGKINQYSYINLQVAIVKAIGQIEPCTPKAFMENPPFEEAPRKRVAAALSILLHRGHIKMIQGERKNQHLLVPRTYREKRRSLQ
ncbi:MAG TPA: hypothetical protein VJA18_03570 [Candidatus Nanoarchaeia archaeon]|nr:hypothetical protein [Candidatus Nanoarchaeia archaeon]